MIKNKALHNLLTKSQISSGQLALAGILVLYLLLVVPTIDRLGIGWDEATDLWISKSYLSLRGFLLGSPFDLSQTRLPMFTVAIVFQLLGKSSLYIARFTTVVVGALTLLGVYIYGKNLFSHETGLLATALLAINPFFLSFARLAFTESDVYLACTVIWLLICLLRLQKTSSMGYAVLSALLLGLSISSKATILVITPAVFVSFILYSMYHNKTDIENGSLMKDSVSALQVLIWAGLALVTVILGAIVSRQLADGGYRNIYRLLNYSWVWLVWLITLGWGIRFRYFRAHPLAIFAYFISLGLLTSVVFPPDHLTNSGIIKSLISRGQNEMVFSFPFFMELAGLHLFTLFLKSTPILGLGLLAAFVSTLIQWRQRELILPLLVAGSYMVGLFLLPLGQTFYTMPVLPILSLLAAHQLLWLYSKRRKLSLAIVILGLAWWGMEMKQCYPDYHLNGYQWLGARPFLGRSSIGYRSIVYVPSDGVQQVVEWLNAHAEPGQVAQLYIEPWHIVDSIAPDPAYKLTDGFEETLASKPDYVVTHTGTNIWQGEGIDTPTGTIFRYPYDLDVLRSEYEQVFVVRRAFGLEIASVWIRK